MIDRSPKDLREIVGARVRQFRQAQGLTQFELAERSGLSVDMVGRLERGRVAPSLDTVAILSEALGLHPSILLGGSPNSQSLEGERERKLEVVFGVLSNVETSELDWLTRVISEIISRPRK